MPVAVRTRKACSPSRHSGAMAKVTLQLRVVDDFQLLDDDAGIVDEDFLGVGEAAAIERDDGLGAALGTPRLDDAERRRRGRCDAAHE